MWDHVQTLLVDGIGAAIGGGIASWAAVRMAIRRSIRAEIRPLEVRVIRLEAHTRINVPHPATEEANSHA